MIDATTNIYEDSKTFKIVFNLHEKDSTFKRGTFHLNFKGRGGVPVPQPRFLCPLLNKEIIQHMNNSVKISLPLDHSL